MGPGTHPTVVIQLLPCIVDSQVHFPPQISDIVHLRYLEWRILACSPALFELRVFSDLENNHYVLSSEMSYTIPQKRPRQQSPTPAQELEKLTVSEQKSGPKRKQQLERPGNSRNRRQDAFREKKGLEEL